MASSGLVINYAGYSRPSDYTGWVDASANSNIVYVGNATTGSVLGTLACKFSFYVDANLAKYIKTVNNLVIELVAQQYSNPSYTTAYLSKTDLVPSQCDIFNGGITDYITSASSDQSGEVNAGETVKYNFGTVSLSAGTYYIYILRNGTSYNGFCAFTNSTGKTRIDVDYLAQYSITYKIGDGSSGLPSNQTKLENTDITLSSTKPVKNNTSSYIDFDIIGNANGGTPNSKKTARKTTTVKHIFDYWSGSDGKKYQPNSTYSGNADITLTAIFKSNGSSDAYTNNTLSGLTSPTRTTDINATYKVTFNPNGGSCNTSSLSSNNTTSYAFANWNSKASEDGTDYNSSSTFTSATTVYAKWTRTTKTSSIVLPIPARNGYDFLGWSNNASDKSGITGSYTPNSSITLYALWKAKGLIRVRINGEIREALAYIHHSGTYMQAIPEVYHNEKYYISG